VPRHPLCADLDQVLTHTTPLWDELRGGRVFITGGTGFFGRWLLESFLHANAELKLGAQAVVLTRKPDAFYLRAPHLPGSAAVRLHQGDVTDFDFPAGTFTHAIHAASELNAPSQQAPADVIRQARRGTQRVLDLARACGVKKLLLTSSGAVYGPAEASGIKRREEDDEVVLPTEPRWAYAAAKREAEALCTAFASAHGFEAKIARGFAFLGPYLPLDAHLAAGNFIRDALRGGPIIVQGSGIAVRSYLYPLDLAVWLWTILFRGLPGRAYNVGSDAPVSVSDLAHGVAGACEPPVPVEVVGRAVPGDPLDFYVPDISRARAELGLNVCIPLEEAIRRTLQWHRRS
jgi:nucleoside-diphosphate-sugar epimerase